MIHSHHHRRKIKTKVKSPFKIQEFKVLYVLVCYVLFENKRIKHYQFHPHYYRFYIF